MLWVSIFGEVLFGRLRRVMIREFLLSVYIIERKRMTDKEIIAYYDRYWNITLSELSRMSGRTVKELKSLLLGE
jgi:hypothetical protein